MGGHMTNFNLPLNVLMPLQGSWASPLLKAAACPSPS